MEGCLPSFPRLALLRRRARQLGSSLMFLGAPRRSVNESENAATFYAGVGGNEEKCSNLSSDFVFSPQKSGHAKSDPWQ